MVKSIVAVCFCMLVWAVLPMQVYAEEGSKTEGVESYAALCEALADGGQETVYLAASIQLEEPLVLERDVAIQGNGHSLFAVKGQRHVKAEDVALTLADVVLEGDGHGGGIEAYGVELALANVTLKGCSDSALYADDCTITIEKSQFTGNRALAGGAAYVRRSTLYMKDCVVQENTAEEAGAGLYLLQNPETELVGCTVQGNHVLAGQGGGIYCERVSEFVLRDCKVLNNMVAAGNVPNEVYGGAGVMLSRDVDFAMYGGEICGNQLLRPEASTAELAGGGLYAHKNALVRLQGVTFAENYSGGDGGAVYIGDYHALSATAISFTGNYAENGAYLLEAEKLADFSSDVSGVVELSYPFAKDTHTPFNNYDIVYRENCVSHTVTLHDGDLVHTQRGYSIVPFVVPGAPEAGLRAAAGANTRLEAPEFLGWHTVAGAAEPSLYPGDVVYLQGDLTLYGVWKPLAPGGVDSSGDDSRHVASGGASSKPDGAASGDSSSTTSVASGSGAASSNVVAATGDGNAMAVPMLVLWCLFAGVGGYSLFVAKRCRRE